MQIIDSDFIEKSGLEKCVKNEDIGNSLNDKWMKNKYREI